MTPPPKAYLLTTAVVFTLLTAAHLWRVAAESRALAADPWYVAITAAAAALALWAWREVWRLSRSQARAERDSR